MATATTTPVIALPLVRSPLSVIAFTLVRSMFLCATATDTGLNRPTLSPATPKKSFLRRFSEDSCARGVTNGNGVKNTDYCIYAGAAYVFVRDGNGQWKQEAYLKARNASMYDFFGSSVAIFGDTALVGAPGDWSRRNAYRHNDNPETGGAAYVFVRDGNRQWAQEAYLKASNSRVDVVWLFGLSVAVSGGIALVGAPCEDACASGVTESSHNDFRCQEAGAAYVFVRDSNGQWAQKAYLKASNTRIGDWFGQLVAISGYTVLVGAGSEDSCARGVTEGSHNNFGFCQDAGAAYSSCAPATGKSVAMFGDTALVGARGEDSCACGVTNENGDQDTGSCPDAGAAYVFVPNSKGDWAHEAYLKPSNTKLDNLFGSSVAISNDVVREWSVPAWERLRHWPSVQRVLGATGRTREASPGAPTSATGMSPEIATDEPKEACDLVLLAFGPATQKKIISSEIQLQYPATLLVGASDESSCASGVTNGNGHNDIGLCRDSGAAYVFVRDGNGRWAQQAYLKASNTESDDKFGLLVAISGDTALVAALHESSCARGLTNGNGYNDTGYCRDAGAVYVFARDSNGRWAQEAYLKASNTLTASLVSCNLRRHCAGGCQR
eukprot:g51336.t1